MTRGVWRLDDIQHFVTRLQRAGLDRRDAETAIVELRDELVTSAYYVPTTDELMRDYARLGAAYLRGHINVGWVMCRETHDALRDRYHQTRYAVPPAEVSAWLRTEPTVEELAPVVRTIMEMRRWSDPGTLFGIPIRIDPVARSPVFEML